MQGAIALPPTQNTPNQSASNRSSLNNAVLSDCLLARLTMPPGHPLCPTLWVMTGSVFDVKRLSPVVCCQSFPLPLFRRLTHDRRFSSRSHV